VIDVRTAAIHANDPDIAETRWVWPDEAGPLVGTARGERPQAGLLGCVRAALISSSPAIQRFDRAVRSDRTLAE
jgi:hypothetical protein